MVTCDKFIFMIKGFPTLPLLANVRQSANFLIFAVLPINASTPLLTADDDT